MKGNRLWLLGTAAVMAVVVLLGWFLGVAPRLAQTDAIELELASVQQLNLAQEAEIAVLREQDANVATLAEDLDDLRDAIPPSVRAENFVDSVSAYAALTGVVVKAVQFEQPGVWGVAPEAEGAPAATADESTVPPPIPTGADGVFTVAVSIQVIGDPLAVIAFSRLVQEDRRLFLGTTFDYAVSPDRVATLAGYLFLYADPSVPLEEVLGMLPDDESTAPEPTPEPTPSATPAPSPTPTPTP